MLLFSQISDLCKSNLSPAGFSAANDRLEKGIFKKHLGELLLYVTLLYKRRTKVGEEKIIYKKRKIVS